MSGIMPQVSFYSVTNGNHNFMAALYTKIFLNFLAFGSLFAP